MIATLISIIVVLLGVAGYLFTRNKTAEALLKNNDIKDQLNTLDGQISKNQGLIDAEKEELERKKHEEVTKDDLLNFLNKFTKPK